MGEIEEKEEEKRGAVVTFYFRQNCGSDETEIAVDGRDSGEVVEVLRNCLTIIGENIKRNR